MIDKQLLEQSREQLQKLREMGLKKKGYDLVPYPSRQLKLDWGWRYRKWVEIERGE